MRYVPNLIPTENKILPDYFEGDIYKAHKSNVALESICWVLGILFCIGGVALARHPVLTLIFGFIGFILTPTGHKWIEKVLSFRFTANFKLILIATILCIAIPLTRNYFLNDKQEIYELKLKAELEEKKQKEREKYDRDRKDSLLVYLQASSTFTKKHKYAEANKKLDYATTFISTESDKHLVSNERLTILATEAYGLVNLGKYKSALPLLDDLVSRDSDNPEHLFNRAICLSRLGKTQDAVNDCDRAARNGSFKARGLYEKLNPLKKRVSYYLTRCCDGSASPSNAKGRGACSHHGGVCDWNEPIYEEYRKYN